MKRRNEASESIDVFFIPRACPLRLARRGGWSDLRNGKNLGRCGGSAAKYDARGGTFRRARNFWARDTFEGHRCAKMSGSDDPKGYSSCVGRQLEL